MFVTLTKRFGWAGDTETGDKRFKMSGTLKVLSASFREARNKEYADLTLVGNLLLVM